MVIKSSPADICLCGSGKSYSSCCHPYHQLRHAPSAEALMRSRYTAYVLGLEDYLLMTWHPDTRPALLNLHEELTTRWLGLEIKNSTTSGEHSAIVEFVARYKINGKAYRLHETSHFEYLDGQWLYYDGELKD